MISCHHWMTLQAGQNRYRDGPKRSSDAKVVTIAEMILWTSDYIMARNSIKMASDGKCFNAKVVRLIETVDFDIKIALI